MNQHSIPNRFNELAELYKSKMQLFKQFEYGYDPKRSYRIKSLKRAISGFQQWLIDFSDLYYDISREALKEDQKGERAKYLNAIIVVMTKIQCVYLMPFDHHLSQKQNRLNIFIAVLSIYLGLAGAVLPFMLPQKDPVLSDEQILNFQTSTTSKLNNIHQKNDSILFMLKAKALLKEKVK